MVVAAEVGVLAQRAGDPQRRERVPALARVLQRRTDVGLLGVQPVQLAFQPALALAGRAPVDPGPGLLGQGDVVAEMGLADGLLLPRLGQPVPGIVDGRTSRARCSNSRTASNSPSADTAGNCPSPGSESGGTGQFRSPSTQSTSRLVARIDRAGQATRSRSASPPRAAVRCSQLSRMSSSDASATCSAIRSAASWCRLSGTPRRAATASPAMAGSSIGASSTQHAPDEKDGPAALATARASRVFPVPPGPVSVSSRLLSRLSSTS